MMNYKTSNTIQTYNLDNSNMINQSVKDKSMKYHFKDTF